MNTADTGAGRVSGGRRRKRSAGAVDVPLTPEAKKAAKEEKRRIRRSAWVDEDLREIPICKGVTIDPLVYQIGENRYWTLLIKGFIVYLITAGGIGSYLTAMEIDFSRLIFHAVILTTALLCACLYHSWKSENLGYLVFFAVYAGTLYLFRDYINSGFYAIVNDTNEWATIYFDAEGLQHYNERIANRYAAVTVAVTLIGIAANILLNNYSLRRARYMIAAFLGSTINLVALYMEKEPELLYSLMVISGVCMTFVLKCGRHFTLSRNDHIFKRRKWGMSYGLDHKSLRQGMLVTLGLVVMIAGVVNFIRPKDTYIYSREQNPYKEVTREYVQNIIMLGFSALWNWYPNNGGLSSGELGGVNSIRLDYQPDLSVTFTPYSYDTLYIKNLIGRDYHPGENYWSQPEDYKTPEGQNLSETETLRQAYEDGNEKAARGVMLLQNIEAAPQTYHPYYSDEEQGELYRGKTQEVVYYPLTDESLLQQESSKMIDPGYLTVDPSNQAAVNGLVLDAGMSEKLTPEENVARLSAYYEENIPYTIRPGATPRRQDFVNYFLTKNKKGYCAHFASAAVLAFRSVGIPARYCEGYAISYEQVLTRGEMVADGEAKYDQYYSGYSILGRTALVNIKATDANAHAWVEIYIDGKGWMVAEVTPSTTIDSDDGTASFWDNFNKWFGDGDEYNASGSDSGDGEGFRIAINDKVVRIIIFVAFGLFLLGGLVFLGIRLRPVLRYHLDYRNGNWSEKLVLYYSRAMRRRRRDPDLSKCVNYREQMECLYDRRREAGVPDTEVMEYREPVKQDGDRVDSPALEELIRTLELAGFSQQTITQEMFDLAKRRLDEILTPVRRPKESKDENRE